MRFSYEGIYREALHEAQELFPCQFSGLIFIIRPGKAASGRKTDVEQYIPVARPKEAFDPVPAASTEEEQGILFQEQIPVVMQSDDRGQAVDALPEIRPADAEITAGKGEAVFSQHSLPPSGSWSEPFR